MVAIKSIDVRGLEFLIGGLQNALIGAGSDTDTIVRDESKLLALEISKRVGPKDRSKAAARIEKSVRSRISDLGNENKRLRNHFGSGVIWTFADKDYLYGVKDDSILRSGDSVASAYFQSKIFSEKTSTIGNKSTTVRSAWLIYPFKHRHKTQEVAIKQKLTATKSALRSGIATVKKAIGKLRASWLATAKKIDPSAVGPQWVERHIKDGKTTKSITDLTGLANTQSPSTTFGSRAVGVGKFSRSIDFAVKVRKQKVLARLRLVLSGYSKDVAQGIRPKRHAKEHHADN